MLSDSFDSHSANVPTPTVFYSIIINVDVFPMLFLARRVDLDGLFIFRVSAHIYIVDGSLSLGDRLVLLLARLLLNLLLLGLRKVVCGFVELVNGFFEFFHFLFESLLVSGL